MHTEAPEHDETEGHPDIEVQTGGLGHLLEMPVLENHNAFEPIIPPPEGEQIPGEIAVLEDPLMKSLRGIPGVLQANH